MESGHLVIFSTSGKFITKFNVLRCISLSETPFWTGARGLIATDRNFLTLVDNMQVVLNQWANRGLSLVGKVLVFKTLGISKMQYLAQMTLIPKHIIQKLIDIQEKFLWKNGKPKIKHSTLIADYKDGGLKVVDIDSKFRALKLTWMKRLCDDNEHPWKNIPQAYLKFPNGDLLFHRNFSTDETFFSKIKGIPKFYVEILKVWENFSENSSEDSTVLFSESLWLNRFIKIGNKSVFSKVLSMNNINTVGDIFDNKGAPLQFHFLTQIGLPGTIRFSGFIL